VRISIVLPVLNEATDIERLLLQVLDQEPPPGGFEILVADGGSSDGTRDIVRALAERHANLTLLENPARRSSAGRNAGAQAATGDVVLFIDGHCSLPRRDYLERVAALFASTNADCLCRPQPLSRLAGEGWGAAVAAARHSFLGHNAGSDIYAGKAGFTDPRSAGAAYRRAVWVDLGGYDERFDACEDVEFNHRVAVAGLRSYVHPDLAVDYRPRSTPGGLLRQMVRYGRGRARLMAKYPGTAPLPLLVITGVALAAILVLPFLGAVPVLAGLGALAGAWLLLVGIESVRGGRSWDERGRIAVAFTAIHLGLTAGFWRGIAEWRRFRRPAPARKAGGEERRVPV
jgi:cellulose synthase/poly-beta-1,6-N-acetylglucosamine synthase-like glycosyltransferase